MYPVSYEADVALEGRNRLTTFFRYFTAIPALIVAFFYAIGAYLGAIVAWFSIVFTGKYPEGIYDFNVKALRMITRVNSYYNLAVDEYPPFNGDDDPSYPVRVSVAPPLAKYDRLKTGLRLLIGIPVLLLSYVWAIIVSVVSIIAWFAIVFTGKLPEGLANPLRGGLSYTTKAMAYYHLLMVEDYPPFSEEGANAPAGQISTGTKAGV
jgi:hypothetical protein